MTTIKRLGIWMDHSNANLMEFTTDPITTVVISSKFARSEKEHSLGKSEDGMHQKEQHQQSAYYKEIAEVIKGYEDVVLFGPSNAKTELFNLLRGDHHFEKVKMEAKNADKMTQNEQHAFVRDYFSHKG